jgi:hypothetical protein
VTACEESPAVKELVAAAGLGTSFRLQPLKGGGNNRVFRVEAGKDCALLKAYFRHPADPRDRLGTEFAFSAFAWDHGLRCLPRPLAQDRRHGLGLYEYVAGRALLPQEVTANAVHQALDFFRELNRHRHAAAARALPDASEACFTLAAHLGCVERRLQRLAETDDTSPLGREAARFVRDELVPAWETVAGAVRRGAEGIGLSLDESIPAESRCLSPSDFGFHNALLTPEGRLCFLDFEYAGWDDPAKLVSDFFCQPAVPVPLSLYETMVAGVVGALPGSASQRERIGLLLPVYQVKWVTILLNHFLPIGGQRRRFAGSAADLQEQKAQQLLKARGIVNDLGRRFRQRRSA